MSQKTSTKPSIHGTFGTKTVTCVYDGTPMRKANTPPGQEIIAGTDTYICPICGWITFFAKKEE